jgi:uncharacterized protein YlzI (FlbEa/FlbD family)
MLKSVKTLMAVSVMAFITACGGGGGGNVSGSGSSTLTSQFIDAPAAGLYYSSAPSGKTGITDSSGNFSYESGDTVSIFLGGAGGVKLGSFKPISGSQVFVPLLPNYLSISQLLIALDQSSSSAYMDFSKIASIPSVTITAINSFLANNSYNATVLSDARNAIQTANTGVTYKNTNFGSSDAASHLVTSSTTVITPAVSLLNNISLINSPFYLWSTTVGGSYSGERQSGFLFILNDSTELRYSSDDTFTKLVSVNKIKNNSITTASTGVTLIDTFSNTNQAVNCPISTTINSVATVNGGIGFTAMYYQNLNGSSNQCDNNKTEFISAYPLDTTFSITSLKGKTLSLEQSCGNVTNQIAISTDSSGNFSIAGNICSIRQQGYFNANNVRNVNNPTVANGTIADVSDFTSLIRFTPAGYNSVMREANAPTMLLSRSKDGAVYYFNISDGGSPGELAGGFLKFVSLQ